MYMYIGAVFCLASCTDYGLAKNIDSDTGDVDIIIDNDTGNLDTGNLDTENLDTGDLDTVISDDSGNLDTSDVNDSGEADTAIIPDTGDGFVRGLDTQHFIDNMIPDHGDLGVGKQFLLRDFFCPQFMAPVDQSHVGCMIG